MSRFEVHRKKKIANITNVFDVDGLKTMKDGLESE